MAWAAPNPTTISGTVSDGQTITVTGTNFSTAPQKPYLFADFEGGNVNPTNLGYLTSWSDNVGFGVTTSNQYFNSVYSSSGLWANGSYGALDFVVDNAVGYNTIYLTEDRRFNFVFDIAGNIKLHRIWPNTGSTGANDMVQGYGSNNGLTTLNEGDPQFNGVIGAYQGSGPSANVWQQQEYLWKYTGGTGRNTDASVRVCDGTAGSPNGDCSGVYISSINAKTDVERQNIYNGTYGHKELILDQFVTAGHDVAAYSHVLIDNVAVTTTQAKVTVSTSSTWSGTVVRKFQPWSSWNNTTINVILKTADLSGTKYLYVTDDNGAVNANGLLLQLGNTPIAPTSLPNITVSSMSFIWTTAGSASYRAVISTSSDFVTQITSGIVVGNTTSYAGLAQRTTYYFQVGVSTEAGYSSAISTFTGGTNLAPSVGSAAQTSLTGSWIGAMSVIRVWDNDADFSSPISSGTASSPDTQGSLTCNSLYYFEVKVASETSYQGNNTSGVTSACAGASPGSTKWTFTGGVNLRGVTVK